MSREFIGAGVIIKVTATKTEVRPVGFCEKRIRCTFSHIGCASSSARYSRICSTVYQHLRPVCHTIFQEPSAYHPQLNANGSEKEDSGRDSHPNQYGAPSEGCPLPCISDDVEQHDDGESQVRLEKRIATSLGLDDMPLTGEIAI